MKFRVAGPVGPRRGGEQSYEDVPTCWHDMLRFVSATVVVGAVLAGVLALPVEVPYAVTVPGKVLPAREWVLVRDQDGSIGSMLRDHVGGTVRGYDAHRFERGDAVRFTLQAGLRPEVRVAVGDTIARIYSNETERRLAALTGRLAAARSALTLHAAGEKAAVVAQAQRRLDQALGQARYYRKEVERLRTLFDRRLVAEQELEAAQRQMQVHDADVAIARAELEAVRTGAKPEQLALAASEVEAHRKEIETLTERREMLTIRSPISGVAVRSFGADTLLAVRDTSAYVVVMPVAWAERGRLTPGQEVDVRLPGLPVRMAGRIHHLGDTLHRLDGEQVVLVTAVVGAPAGEVVAGALAECTVAGAPVRLIEWVRRVLWS